MGKHTQLSISRGMAFWGGILVMGGMAIVMTFYAPTPISFLKALQGELFQGQETVLWSLRVPRLLLAFFVGAGLAVAGVVFQAVFRNSLASPYTLGVSGGAAFGAALGIQFVTQDTTGMSLSLFALLGAGLSIAILFAATCLSINVMSDSMLLIGVVLNFFWASLILFVQYISDASEVFLLSRWLMGSLNVAGYQEVMWVSSAALVCTLLLVVVAPTLNLLSLGAEFAQSRGVSLRVSSLSVILLASILTAVIVSFAGPIGFVGIMIPHFVRRTYQAMHLPLLIGSFFLGGVFLALSDSIARTALHPVDLPVGIVTALFGAPFLIWALIARGSARSSSHW